jgi:acetyl-CoA C-acetyltransferase
MSIKDSSLGAADAFKAIYYQRRLGAQNRGVLFILSGYRYDDVMPNVYVAGIGKTNFGAFPDRELALFCTEAIGAALADAAVAPDAVEAFYLGNFDGPRFTGQNHLAPYVARLAGLNEIPATRFEAACASGGASFLHAAMAVASGLYETVLVCGVEKMTSQTTARVAEILAGAGDAKLESAVGATFPAIFAMVARRHMHEFGTTREHLAHVAVKNHANAALNPQAHLKKVITIEQALAGKPVAEPFTIYDCSLVSDGAAAVVLTSKPSAIRVAGLGQASGPVALADRSSLTAFPATQKAAAKAYQMAKCTAKDIQVAEVHDCFTIAELIAMEDLGFVPLGESGPWVASGATTLQGSLPVNTSGGLKAKGHPVGATGVAQICDLAIQLRGQAGARQVAGAERGLAQNLGGSGATSVVTILETA